MPGYPRSHDCMETTKIVFIQNPEAFKCGNFTDYVRPTLALRLFHPAAPPNVVKWFDPDYAESTIRLATLWSVFRNDGFWELLSTEAFSSAG